MTVTTRNASLNRLVKSALPGSSTASCNWRIVSFRARATVVCFLFRKESHFSNGERFRMESIRAAWTLQACLSGPFRVFTPLGHPCMFKPTFSHQWFPKHQKSRNRNPLQTIIKTRRKRIASDIFESFGQWRAWSSQPWAQYFCNPAFFQPDLSAFLTFGEPFKQTFSRFWLLEAT